MEPALAEKVEEKERNHGGGWEVGNATIISVQRVRVEPNYPPESTGCRIHPNGTSAMQERSPVLSIPAPRATVSKGLLQCTTEDPVPRRQFY